MTWWEELKIPRTSGWDKLKILSGAIAAVLVPVAVVWVGHIYTKAVKEREQQGKFVELAVGILQQEPTGEQTNLRDWAVDVLDEYSGVPMPEVTRLELRATPLPAAFTQESEIQYGSMDDVTQYMLTRAAAFKHVNRVWYNTSKIVACLETLGYPVETEIPEDLPSYDKIHGLRRSLRTPSDLSGRRTANHRSPAWSPICLLRI